MRRATQLARGLLAAGLILGSAAAGFALRAEQGRSQPAPLNPTHALHAATTAAPTEARSHPAAHSIANTLPNIVFRDRSGTLRRLSHWQGHPLLVNFWAPWCSPCRAEVPLLERLSRSRPHGVEVIGVAVDTRATVLRYARHAGIRYPLLIGLRTGMRAIRALGMVSAFPFSVFVDAHGRIVTVKVGRLHAAQARLILGRIGALDRGQIDLATARREIAAGIARLAAPSARTPASHSVSA